MYNKRVFLEYELPVPYKGISILYEPVDDEGLGGYDVYISHGGTITRIYPARDFPTSALKALQENIDWVEYFANRIRLTDPEGACTLVGKDFVLDDEDVSDLISEL